ncbi:MAG: BCCT family transporter, partial [Rhodovulum sp.]|nr:BCCT family transporter [Rhodovulum sp.]
MADENNNMADGIPSPDGAANLIDTEYELGQDNVEGSVGPLGFDIHNPVFPVSGAAVVAFVFYTLVLPDQAGAVFSWLFGAVTKGFDWFFLGAANIFVIFCLLLIVTPLGNVRLGGAEAKPDYGYVGW